MFLLLTNTTSGEVIYLTGKNEFKVGRKNCDILLENDPTISRDHAVIRIKNDEVTVEDLKSKHGVYIKGKKLLPNQQTLLNHRDEVQFGIRTNIFCFESCKYIVAATSLKPQMKKTLKQVLPKCQAKYSDQWTEKCTHLTVEKVTLTLKLLQALIDEKPIVTADYWLAYAESVEKNQPLPDVNNYNKPAIAEQMLRSDFVYEYNSKRKSLFANKMFVFLKKEVMESMKPIIKGCGGQCMSWESPKTWQQISQSTLEHLFIKAESQEAHVSYDSIITQLSKENKRAIPLNEIALAIMHCSCDVNCNPKFNKVTSVFRKQTQKFPDQNILALETQSQALQSQNGKTQQVVPATLEEDMSDVFVGRKRVGEEVNGAAKRIRVANKESLEKEDDIVSVAAMTRKIVDEKKKDKRQTTMNMFISKDASSKPQNVQDETQTQKRKASDESVSPNLNPFSSIQTKKSKVTDEHNPFQLLLPKSAKAKSAKTNDNPFASIKVSKRHPVDNSLFKKPVKVEEVTFKEPAVDFSTIRSRDVSYDSSANSTWLSKYSFKAERSVNEDLVELVRAFKNCVNVVTMDLSERSRNSVLDVSGDSLNGKKNFKKFRKVKPLHPQSTIIARHHLVQVGAGDVADIFVNQRDESDEENEQKPPIKAKKGGQRSSKKFVI